jgi:hypothetical protein
LVEGGRALSYLAAHTIDLAQHAPDPDARHAAASRAGLLTPIVKALLTDHAVEVAQLGIQVLGGHGYVREWGLEQYLRDARITTIYEGTNGIQALDLLGRKVLADGGIELARLAAEIRMFAASLPTDERAALVATTDLIERVTRALLARGTADPEVIAAAATPYLRLVGLWILQWLWARMTAAVHSRSDLFAQRKRATAAFFCAHVLPEISTLVAQIDAPAQTLLPDALELI